MRKIILVLFVSLLILPFVPRMVYAGDTVATHEDDRTVNVADSDDAVPECNISLSRNVSFSYNVADADAQSYEITSLHYSGDKEYGTASDTTLIFWQTSDTGGTAASAGAEDSGSVTGGSPWNPL